MAVKSKIKYSTNELYDLFNFWYSRLPDNFDDENLNKGKFDSPLLFLNDKALQDRADHYLGKFVSSSDEIKITRKRDLLSSEDLYSLLASPSLRRQASNSRKILFKTPLKDLAEFVNHEEIGPVAIWRLYHNK